MAERPSEVAALKRRVMAAQASAAATGSSANLNAFAEAVRDSSAVMNRTLGALSAWVTGPNPMFLSYHRQVEAGRIPGESNWDEQRSAAEAAINPYCYRELNFAALTLDRSGMTYYGEYSVTLRAITIETRSSVFEQNPFYFNQHHGVIAGTSPPTGYRAPWSNRDQLAIAKLHQNVSVATTPQDYPGVLLDSKRDQPDCDFIEVHVYGPINRAGIESVKGPQPKRRADKALWQQIVRALDGQGAKVEETP